MRRAALTPAGPPWMTILVFSSATMLMVLASSFDPNSSCPIHRACVNCPINLELLPLQRIVHNIRKGSMPVIHMDLKPLLSQRPHRRKPLFLVGAAAPYPDMDILELALCPDIPETCNNPGKGLFHIGKVRYRPPDDDMLDVRKRTHPFGEGLYCPVWRV